MSLYGGWALFSRRSIRVLQEAGIRVGPPRLKTPAEGRFANLLGIIAALEMQLR